MGEEGRNPGRLGTARGLLQVACQFVGADAFCAGTGGQDKGRALLPRVATA